MAEEGLEREMENGASASVDSTESRWVFQDKDESDFDNNDDDGDDDDEDFPSRNDGDSEEDDTVEQRLIRTGHRINSFDVEALDIPGAQRNEFEKRLEGLTEAELEALLEQVEEEKRRLASGEKIN